MSYIVFKERGKIKSTIYKFVFYRISWLNTIVQKNIFNINFFIDKCAHIFLKNKTQSVL